MTRDEFTHLSIGTSIVNKKTGYIPWVKGIMGDTVDEFIRAVSIGKALNMKMAPIAKQAIINQIKRQRAK